MDFYPENWLSDTNNAALTFEEQGVHIYLLCRMWDQPDCTLPNDNAQIARWLKVSVRRWMKWRSVLIDGDYPVLFVENGRIFSKKLRKIFKKSVENSRIRSEAASARWTEPIYGETASDSHSRNAQADAQDTANADANAYDMHANSEGFASPRARVPLSTLQVKDKDQDQKDVVVCARESIEPLPPWFESHWMTSLHGSMPPAIAEVMTTYRRPTATGPPLPWEVIRWAMTQAGLKSTRRNKWPLLEVILNNLHRQGVSTIEDAMQCPIPKGAPNDGRNAHDPARRREPSGPSLDALVQGGYAGAD